MENQYTHKVVFGKQKQWLALESGNLKIEYDPKNHIYMVNRIDGQSFDGHEYVGGQFFGNMAKPQTIDEILEYEVDALSGLQIEPEVNLFIEFDWGYNEDKTKIIILPVFLEELINVEIKLTNVSMIDMGLYVGKRKKVRKGNIEILTENVKQLTLKKES